MQDNLKLQIKIWLEEFFDRFVKEDLKEDARFYLNRILQELGVRGITL